MPQLRGPIVCHGCGAPIEDLADAVLTGSCLYCGDLCEARAVGSNVAQTIPQLWAMLWGHKRSDPQPGGTALNYPDEGPEHIYRLLCDRLDEMKRRAEDMLRRIQGGKSERPGFDA